MNVDDDVNSSRILTPADFLSFHRGQAFPNIVEDPGLSLKQLKEQDLCKPSYKLGKEDRIISTNLEFVEK